MKQAQTSNEEKDALQAWEKLHPQVPRYKARRYCTTCGLYFSTTRTYLRHRRKPIGCLPVEVLQRLGFQQTDEYVWILAE